MSAIKFHVIRPKLLPRNSELIIVARILTVSNIDASEMCVQKSLEVSFCDIIYNINSQLQAENI